ncbi:MAG: UDPGP type 1 family protein [Phycisphaerae bacterium]
MKRSPGTHTRLKRCRRDLETRNQQHVLRFWDELSDHQRDHLLTDVESIPWDVVDPLVQSHILTRPEQTVPTELSPPCIYPRVPGVKEKPVYADAERLGRELIGAGKVAAFTVAGGQGTRLGYDCPKGAVVVTPVGERTLFQLFAEAVLANRRRYNASVRWYILTSRSNHGETIEFFKSHNHFGLPEDDVVFFSQGMLPAFDFDGRILMESKHALSLAPDGHGGSLKALCDSGALADMRSRGIEIVSYFQVDNPLVKPIDPLFIGLHTKTGSEMSTKVATKADDLERVGNICVHDGKVIVVEYSDFPDELAHARNPDGNRRFDAGNLAIHLLNVDFVERVVGKAFRLPFRRADKIVAFVDESGTLRRPDQPNAVKLETFIFDVLPLAKQPLLLEVDRAEEFSPVKNPTGVDSLDSSKRDQNARACRWLESAGIEVPRKPDGQPDVTVYISPMLALDPQDVKEKIAEIPSLRSGDHAILA